MFQMTKCIPIGPNYPNELVKNLNLLENIRSSFLQLTPKCTYKMAYYDKICIYMQNTTLCIGSWCYETHVWISICRFGLQHF